MANAILNFHFDYWHPSLNEIARNAEEQGAKTERRLRQATILAHFVSPVVAITFAVIYWAIGMYNVIHPDMQREI